MVSVIHSGGITTFCGIAFQPVHSTRGVHQGIGGHSPGVEYLGYAAPQEAIGSKDDFEQPADSTGPRTVQLGAEPFRSKSWFKLNI